MTTILVNNLDETEAFGRLLGSVLFPGAMVALVGPLGAGKTHLVRAIAEGLGIANADIVSSPTFVLIQEYAARLPIYHFDAYRLTSSHDFADLGVHEYYESGGVCLLEWADKVRDVLPAEWLELQITITGEESRRIDVRAQGARHQELLDRLMPPSGS